MNIKQAHPAEPWGGSHQGAAAQSHPLASIVCSLAEFHLVAEGGINKEVTVSFSYVKIHAKRTLYPLSTYLKYVSTFP
jgi:hypothetical protein